MSADLRPTRLSRRSLYTIVVVTILVLMIVGVFATKFVRDNARKAEAYQRIKTLKSALDKDTAIGKRGEIAHTKYQLAIQRASDAGQKRHDVGLSSNPSSEREKKYALEEQSSIAEAIKYVSNEIDTTEEVVFNFGEIFGSEVVRKSHDDVSAYREARLAELQTWQRAVDAVVDEYIAGHELDGVSSSVIRETYDSITDRTARATKLEETEMQDISDLIDKLTKELKKADVATR